MLLLAMETQAPQLKYCLYARKSSESDERQAMSIDSQLAEMRALAVNEGLNVVCELQESHSAKDSSKRTAYTRWYTRVYPLTDETSCHKQNIMLADLLG